MDTKSYRYWEEVEKAFEEAVGSGRSLDIDRLPDLEILAMTCPYHAMRDELLKMAKTIVSRMELDSEFKSEVENSDSNYLDTCFSLHGNS